MSIGPSPDTWYARWTPSAARTYFVSGTMAVSVWVAGTDARVSPP